MGIMMHNRQQLHIIIIIIIILYAAYENKDSENKHQVSVNILTHMINLT